MKTNPELTKLEKIALNSRYGVGVNTNMVEYSFRVFSRHIRGKNILELGPAEGIMTELLNQTGLSLTIVEGASKFCINLRERFPKAKVVHSLFEDFNSVDKYDNIILGHVLEHVEDPIAVLQMAKSWLKEDGVVLSAVPNSRSLHRQAAVMMGLLPFEEAMNEADLHHGHRRVFNPETFRNVFIQSGLQIDFFGGYWLKPVSNRQLEESWTPSMLDAYMQLGERYPDIAGDIYIVAKHRKENAS